VSSLAQVHLGTGDVQLAEQQSRHAFALLGDRDDFVDEIGNVQIVLGVQAARAMRDVTPNPGRQPAFQADPSRRRPPAGTAAS
jgi:hypothetical protein